MDEPLNDDALAALEELLSESMSLRRAAAVRLAGSIGPDTVVSLDRTSTRRLGAPLVVVRQGRGSDLDVSVLTPREVQVVHLIADGLANKEIARQLLISVATVKDHVHSILTKTGLPSRAAVAARIR